MIPVVDTEPVLSGGQPLEISATSFKSFIDKYESVSSIVRFHKLGSILSIPISFLHIQSGVFPNVTICCIKVLARSIFLDATIITFVEFLSTKTSSVTSCN